MVNRDALDAKIQKEIKKKLKKKKISIDIEVTSSSEESLGKRCPFSWPEDFLVGRS